ncbi:hypothetical protein Patl1_09693 [Pistacia atlantica]|uniref:Uncharacterized protein n=1 Tax=Pistacia atlantica TaxID=434234 RepID=A0ACC1A9L1_9ROSI|nr:hypothetical protein Patl1_09693 [Pistacia atlantica]
MTKRIYLALANPDICLSCACCEMVPESVSQSDSIFLNPLVILIVLLPLWMEVDTVKSTVDIGDGYSFKLTG